MTQGNFKLIIAEGLDVHFFSSEEKAQSYLEPADVQQLVYKGFDRDGRLLKITTDGKRVTISLAETEPMHVGELTSLLQRYLEAIGQPCHHCELQELLRRCERFLDEGT